MVVWKSTWLTITGIFLLSCTNDIDINIPDKCIPVVHFILDPLDNNYYATVTKSGVTAGSLYYNNNNTELFYLSDIQLDLELWNDTIKLWHSGFSETDIKKDPGIFPSGPGYLYKSDNVIPEIMSDVITNGNPVNRYFRIIVNSEIFEKTAYSRVELVPYPKITIPRFIDQYVKLYDTGSYAIEWNANEGTRYFDLFFELIYWETDITGNTSVQCREFIYSRDIQSNSNTYQVLIDPDNFYKRLASCFDSQQDSVEYRKFKSFNIVVMGADRNFEDYMAHYNMSLENNYREWTNIINGLGLFTIKYLVRKEGFKLHPIAVDSLSMGRFTNGLKFVRY